MNLTWIVIFIKKVLKNKFPVHAAVAVSRDSNWLDHGASSHKEEYYRQGYFFFIIRSKVDWFIAELASFRKSHSTKTQNILFKGTICYSENFEVDQAWVMGPHDIY